MLEVRSRPKRVAPDYTASDGLDAAKLVRIGGTVLDPCGSDILTIGWGARPRVRAAPSGRRSAAPEREKSLLIQARSEAGMLFVQRAGQSTRRTCRKPPPRRLRRMRDFFEGPKLRRLCSRDQDGHRARADHPEVRRALKFLARTCNGGRGQHGDLLIFDEAWSWTRRSRRRFCLPSRPA